MIYLKVIKASGGYGNRNKSSKMGTCPLMIQACKGNHFSTVGTLIKWGNF